MVAEQNNVVTGIELMAMCLHMTESGFKELLLNTTACSGRCSLFYYIFIINRLKYRRFLYAGIVAINAHYSILNIPFTCINIMKLNYKHRYYCGKAGYFKSPLTLNS